MIALLLLTSAPAVLLLGLVASGVRPGEASLVRLARRRSAPSRAPLRLPRPRLALVAQFTSRLLTTAAAGRAPPR